MRIRHPLVDRPITVNVGVNWYKLAAQMSWMQGCARLMSRES